MQYALSMARVVGALAIGASGLLHVLGNPEIANALMVLGTAAAAPGGRNE